MYTIDCPWFDSEFETIELLIIAVRESGTDPNYEILKDGKPTGEILWDLMEDQV